MKTITITDAMHMSRVRSVCPERGRVLLAATHGPVQGTAVSAFATVPTTAPVYGAGQNPTFVVGDFGTVIKDLSFRPSGGPPV